MENKSINTGGGNHSFEYSGDLLLQVDAAARFILELVKGNIDASPPARGEVMSDPLKELQSQLRAFTWSMEQLAKGHIVSKVLYRGSMYTAYNRLIDLVASLSARPETCEVTDNAGPVNSWRYHHLLMAMNNLHIMVIEVDDSGVVTFANRTAREYIGSIASFSEVTGLDDKSELMEYLAFFDGDSHVLPASSEICDSPENIWYKVTTDRVEFSNGNKGYLHVIDNISAWKAQEGRLIHSALTDPLTKLFNRKAGMEALETSIASSKSGAANCIAFFDMDGLKMINDTHGHDEGDCAITTVAGVMSSCVRSIDTVSRYGGDEFLIVFRNCSIEAAENAIGRIYHKLEKINSSGLLPYPLSVSHGIMEIPHDITMEKNDIIKSVDSLMYREKRKKNADR